MDKARMVARDVELASTIKSPALPPDSPPSPPYPPRWSVEETDNPHYADDRNFYKVEKWTRDSQQVDRMLWAGSSFDKARAEFEAAVKHRPAIVATIRQRARVIDKWPRD